MIPLERLTFITALSQIGTRLHLWFSGERVGEDEFGNRYFRARRRRGERREGQRERRWVLYNGEPEASHVPPEWHAWLHHLSDAPLQKGSAFHKPWIKPHQPNLTGTRAAYRPPGHTLNDGVRAKATGDYVPWSPDKTQS